jgi:hypothetical protein
MNSSSPIYREPPFTASDVVEVYLHRGAFEHTLFDEDQEIDPDRWCSHSAWGQEAWHIVAQWIWNVRLELGHQLHPDPVRIVSRLLRHDPRLTSSSPAPVAMASPRLPHPGKLIASPGRTSSSSPMARCAVLLIRNFRLTSGAGRPMGACAWCTPRAFAVVALVPCANSANGMAGRRQSRGR